MAGFYGRFISEWECVKPEKYHEDCGTMKWTDESANEVTKQFLKANPDYRVVGVKFKD